MANKTRAEMIDKVLQRLRVLGAGQSANANDAAIVGDVLDSVHSCYAHRGMAPFATSAFPDWSQEAFAKLIAKDAAAYFGLGNDGAIRADAAEAERELTEQVARNRHSLPVRFRSY